MNQHTGLQHCGTTNIHQLGWTLSEMMIALAVMAILAALALPGFHHQQRQAQGLQIGLVADLVRGLVQQVQAVGE